MKANRLLRPLALACLGTICAAGNFGLFESNSDIGAARKGAGELDGLAHEYRVTGGGADIWGRADAFHFVWTKMSGDMAVTADVQLTGASMQEKRKAALMIRQSLDANSAYADVAFHGNGEIAAQWRLAANDASGDAVQKELMDTGSPVRIRIERHGDRFTVMAGKPGGELVAMPPNAVVLADPVYVGLAVCSHDANGLTAAVFSNVKLETLSGNH